MDNTRANDPPSTPATPTFAAGRSDWNAVMACSCERSSWARGSIRERMSLSTHPWAPSLRTVPQNSQALDVPPESGAPQLGQWAEEIPLPASVLAPAWRKKMQIV